MDLRWQRSDRPMGFYGYVDGVRMRDSTDSNFQINWGSFDSNTRFKEVSNASHKVNIYGICTVHRNHHSQIIV